MIEIEVNLITVTEKLYRQSVSQTKEGGKERSYPTEGYDKYRPISIPVGRLV